MCYIVAFDKFIPPLIVDATKYAGIILKILCKVILKKDFRESIEYICS